MMESKAMPIRKQIAVDKVFTQHLQSIADDRGTQLHGCVDGDPIELDFYHRIHFFMRHCTSQEIKGIAYIFYSPEIATYYSL